MKRDLLIFSFFVLLYSFSLSPLFYTGGDNAHYLILAKSLSEGKGYRIISQPLEPPETNYPPLFPLLLSPLVKIFGFHPLPGKILVMLMGLASFWVVRGIFSSSLLPFLFLLNPLVLEYSGIILTEIPFLFFSLLTLLFVRKERPLFASLFLLLTLTTRWMGITLLISLTIFWGLRKETRKLFFLLPLYLIPLFWFVRGRVISPETGYLASLLLRNPYHPQAGTLTIGEGIKRIIWNGGAYALRDLPGSLFPFLTRASIEYFHPLYFSYFLCGIIISGIILRGWWRELKKEKDSLSFYFPVYFLPLLIWFWRGNRFLVPLIPLIVYYLLKGGEGRTRVLVYFLVFFLIFSSIFEDVKILGKRGKDYPPHWRSYIQAGKWLKNNTSPEIRVMTRNPFLFYLFSERKSVEIPLQSPEKIFSRLKKYRIEYLVVPPPLPGVKKEEDIMRRYLIPFLEEYNRNLTLVREMGNPPTRIYKVLE